jgi:hypothetical protein
MVHSRYRQFGCKSRQGPLNPCQGEDSVSGDRYSRATARDTSEKDGVGNSSIAMGESPILGD